jgi:hypothetical protein
MNLIEGLAGSLNLTTVATSAAVAALVSGLAILLNGRWDRASRRKERAADREHERAMREADRENERVMREADRAWEIQQYYRDRSDQEKDAMKKLTGGL